MHQTIAQLMVMGTIKFCFDKCVTRPGKDLSSGEKQCLAMCQDRYKEAFEKTFFKMFKSFTSGMGRGGGGYGDE